MTRFNAFLSPREKITLAEARITINKKSYDDQVAILKKIIDVSNQQVKIMDMVKSLQQSAIPAAPSHTSDSQVYAAWAQSATNNAYLTALKALYDKRMKSASNMCINISEAIANIQSDELLITSIMRNSL